MSDTSGGGGVWFSSGEPGVGVSAVWFSYGKLGACVSADNGAVSLFWPGVTTGSQLRNFFMAASNDLSRRHSHAPAHYTTVVQAGGNRQVIEANEVATDGDAPNADFLRFELSLSSNEDVEVIVNLT